MSQQNAIAAVVADLESATFRLTRLTAGAKDPKDIARFEQASHMAAQTIGVLRGRIEVEIVEETQAEQFLQVIDKAVNETIAEAKDAAAGR